jgi:cytochrome c oxidase accessory protein FixG
MYTASDPLLKVESDTEEFRDHINTINQKGRRAWVFAKKPSGTFYRLRSWVSYVLLGLMFAGPYMRMHGQPVLLLNVLERKFILFGFVFWPQDFYLVVLGLLTMILTIVLFTAVFGRIWCGWACPQTVFLEMLFRKLDYLIEGDFQAQKQLAIAPWKAEKILKKGGKMLIFYILSFVIANTFLAYIIGSEELWKIIREPVQNHIGGFIAINVFTLLFFGVFARFREQVCHFACPYGRFQSALVDNDTINVTYDFKRGEKRATLGQRKKGLIAVAKGSANIEGSAGDCIDCGACVVVCPEGIDIRNGIQLECIQCTACIDACNKMMKAVGKPPGLIRYTSYNSVTKGYKLPIKLRTLGYLILWLTVLSVFSYLLLSREKIETVLLRQPGMLAQKMPDGNISNLYSVKVFNKTFDRQNAAIRLVGIPGEISMIDPLKEIGPQNVSQARFFIILKPENIHASNLPIELDIVSNGTVVGHKKTVFIAGAPGG